MNKKLFLINNNLYLPIFPEFAEFLVNNTTIDVYYLHPKSSNIPKTKLTPDNLYYYTNNVDEKGVLFANMGELPSIKISMYTNDNEIIVEPIYDSFNYLYWGE